jgi:hypothetical protein
MIKFTKSIEYESNEPEKQFLRNNCSKVQDLLAFKGDVISKRHQ